MIGGPTDETALRSAFAVVDFAFVNLNSFSLGIKNELYWGIRIFEIAVQSLVKHYVWSSLDDYALETKYDDAIRCGHYYGKAAWWKIYQNSGKNTELGLCKRDYALLDEIYPGRIRSLKQWMEKIGYDGDATRTFEAELPWGV